MQGVIRKAKRVGKNGITQKNMKKFSFKLVLMVLALSMVFVSCKKDETELSNEATYDGTTLTLKKGFHENHGGWYQTIYFAAKDITFDQNAFSYSEESDGLVIDFYLPIGASFGGTYQLTNEFEVDNTVRNAEIRINGVSIYSTDEDTGSVVITKDGDIYEITCSFTIDGKKLEAYYKGELTYANLFMPGKK